MFTNIAFVIQMCQPQQPTYRFPWDLTLVSANHASSNPGLVGTLMRISDVNDIFPLAKRYLVVLLFVGGKHLFLKFPTNYAFDGKEMR